MVEALVMDGGAIEILARAEIEDRWFTDFLVPAGTNIHRIETDGIVYLLSLEADEHSKFFICNVGPTGIGHAQNPSIPFSRALRMALSIIGTGVGIPRTYKLFVQGNLRSIYAYHYNMQDRSRLCFRTDQHLFLYAMAEDVVNLQQVGLSEALFRKAMESIEDSLLNMYSHSTPGTPEIGNFGIVFDDLIDRRYNQKGLTIEDWIDRQLTLQQKQFVDAPLNRPIRLRGSAGTGKTQCMAIKCLKEIFEAQEREVPIRIAFLTHSSSVAHEVVEGMIWALDPENRRRSHLWVGSLYEFAKEKLGYELRNIVPLSLDGVEGRAEQRKLLSDCVEDCIKDSNFKERSHKCSDFVRSGLADLNDRFLSELANEVACSLDSEGVKKTDQEKIGKYLHGSRHPWQMQLENLEDRQVILDIYEKYADLLVDTDTINLDQMIADLYGYLNSNAWRINVRSQGFDLVFIDELHCFNRYERLVFHLLLRESEINRAQKTLFMAYDMRQSTDDRALFSPGGIGRFFQTLQAGESELVELTQVFRSTPEIALLLECVDRAFPALDLEGEWRTYFGESDQEQGDVPRLCLYSDVVSMLDGVIDEAYRYSRQGGGKNVAVLCMSESEFPKFANAGRYRNKISVVTNNTDLSPIKSAKTRCIFSMPENVAGLQFDRVYVVNVDRRELDADELTVGARRRVLSRLYLAASRASRYLTLAASEDCGGYSRVLNSAVQVDAIELLRIDE